MDGTIHNIEDQQGLIHPALVGFLYVGIWGIQKLQILPFQFLIHTSRTLTPFGYPLLPSLGYSIMDRVWQVASQKNRPIL